MDVRRDDRMRGGDPLLAADGILKAFGAFRVLDGVSLRVDKDEIVGLLGPNGSGKSTLLNLLSGFYSLDAGRVRMAGNDITRLAMHERAQLGLVRTFQLPAMPARMTALDVLLAGSSRSCGVWASLFASATDAQAQRDAERARALLADYKLEKVADLPASALSGGQKKLLSIATAMMSRPRLLCLDEPTAGVHPNLRLALVDMLRSCRAQGTAIIVIEHDMRFIAALCDRCIVLDRGDIIADCHPKLLSSIDRVAAAYLGDHTPKVAAP